MWVQGRAEAGTKGAPDSSDCPLSTQGDAAIAAGPPGPRGAKGDMVSRSGPHIQTGFLLVVGGAPLGAGPGDLRAQTQMVKALQPLSLTSDP